MNQAIFLDRDGVINRDLGFDSFILCINDMQLLPNSAYAIRKINKSGLLAIVVSNQRCVGDNFISKADLDSINERMQELLRMDSAYVDNILCCIHRKEDNCNCRKPKPGLLLKAAKEYDIDLANSWLIGDRERDVEAGKAAGCKTIMVETNTNGLLKAVEKILYEG